MPPLLAALGMDTPVLSVGPSRRGLGFHNHGSTWQAVVRGRKLFLLVPPVRAADMAERWCAAAPARPRSIVPRGEALSRGMSKLDFIAHGCRSDGTWQCT